MFSPLNAGVHSCRATAKVSSCTKRAQTRRTRPQRPFSLLVCLRSNSPASLEAYIHESMCGGTASHIYAHVTRGACYLHGRQGMWHKSCTYGTHVLANRTCKIEVDGLSRAGLEFVQGAGCSRQQPARLQNQSGLCACGCTDNTKPTYIHMCCIHGTC